MSVRQNVIETVMGAVVLVLAGFFLVFAYTSGQVHVNGGYTLSAEFDRIDGLNQGSDVLLSGVKIGSVTKMAVDPKSFLAIVDFTVDPAVQLPNDTSAEIVSAGFLSEKKLVLVPGGSEKNLVPGDIISKTQPSVSLEALIGQLIFSNKEKAKESNK